MVEKKSFWESDRRFSNVIIFILTLFVVVNVLFLTLANRLTSNQVDSLFELLKFVAGGIVGYIVGRKTIKNGK